MPGFGNIDARIDALCTGDVGTRDRITLAREMEDVLCDGYAALLQADSTLRRLNRRRLELEELRGEPGVDAALAGLDGRVEALVRACAGVRSRLEPLRDRFVRLGGAAATAR